MSTRVALHGAHLRYGGGIRLHTARSGPVDALEELYLVIERAGALAGAGAVRANVAYLTNVPAGAVPGAIRALVEALDWRADWPALLDRLHAIPAPAVARCAIDVALHDAAARAAGVPLAVRLGGALVPRVPTNQTLFWLEDAAAMFAQAERFVAHGFRSLKLRAGLAPLGEDLDRLAGLRARLGSGIELAVDANGAWSRDEARRAVVRMAELGVAYVEQPVPADDWVGLYAVAERGIAVMADESLNSPDDAARLRPPLLAHLKLVKLIVDATLL
jgi:L-alanine-DL-glutamate epimerase-like enolase superfamily enzyme